MATRPAKGKGSRQKLNKMHWLDPGTATDFAYALHSANNKLLNDTPTGDLATKLAKTFNGLLDGLVPGSPDWEYLVQVQPIVLSHANGITRRKKEYAEEVSRAKVERRMALMRVRGGRTQSVLLNMLRTIGAISIVMGLIGLFMTLAVGPTVLNFLPEGVQNKHSVGFASFAMLFVFGGIGKAVSYKWNDFSVSRIEMAYQRRLWLARLTYEKGKLDEIRYNRQRLCFLWRQFTGSSFQEKASYIMVLEGDIATEKAIEAIEENLRVTDIVAMLSMVSKPLKTLWALRKKKTKTLEPAVIGSV